MTKTINIESPPSLNEQMRQLIAEIHAKYPSTAGLRTVGLWRLDESVQAGELIVDDLGFRDRCYQIFATHQIPMCTDDPARMRLVMSGGFREK